ncbi:MAG: hypothetical protein M1127_01810 [Patescibacteria group bacterium]|nr:hypothetical protein [Patescibacteria group bacterium]
MSEANFFKEKSPEEILKANEKRLRSWVKPYKQPDSSLGAEDDLMQIARVAFLDAIKTFDPKKTKSKNFDTWAWFCVRKAVVGELREKGGGLSGGSSEQRGDPVIKKAQNFGIDVSNTDKAVPSSPDDSRIQALAKHFKLSPQSVASRLLLAQTKEMAKQEVRLDKIPASEVFISSGNKTTGRIEGQENNILYSIGFEKPIDDKMADEQLLEIINGLLPKIESLGNA